jgi:4-hydroxybenzoate polyprenyltransferase
LKRFFSWSSVSPFLRLMRLTDWSDFFLHYVKLIALLGISALFFTSQRIDLAFLFLTAFTITAEIFAFVVNDLSDAKLDALDPETRNPLVKGEISTRGVTCVMLISIVVSVSLLSFLPLRSKVFGVAGLVLSLAYSWGVRAKLKPFLDIGFHGVLNVFPFVMGYTLYRSFDETCLLTSSAICIIGAVTGLLAQLKDYDYDGTFGKSTAVFLGKRRAISLSLGLMSVWFILFARVFEGLISFPVPLFGIRVPIQFLVLPPLSIFILMPLIRGILNESYQTEVYGEVKKRGLIILVILIFSSVGVLAYSSKSHFHGDPQGGDCIVRLNVRTVIAGHESWSVAFIKFRYTDEANHYYLLLDQDGVLELTKVVDSEKTFLTFVGTGMSPFDAHRFEIKLKGSLIQVSVDDVLYIELSDKSLSKGNVLLSGLCCARLAFFDDVIIEHL